MIEARLLAQMQIGNWSTHAGGLEVLQPIPRLAGRELGYDELAKHAVQTPRRIFVVASLARDPGPLPLEWYGTA